MKDKTLTIWTFILNFLIVIKAGHGIAPLELVEIFGLQNFYSIGTEYFSSSLTASYEKIMGIAAILSLLGQITLLISLAIKQKLTG